MPMTKNTEDIAWPTADQSAPIERLPQYFPTFEPKCFDQATDFFQCFEEAAQMQNPTDKESCKLAIGQCEALLRTYMKCQEGELARAQRPWYKFW